jgi:hypothetical protein
LKTRLQCIIAVVAIFFGAVVYSQTDGSQALDINPEDASAWYNLEIAYKKSDQRARVIEVCKTLKALNPSKAEIFFKLYVIGCFFHKDSY